MSSRASREGSMYGMKRGFLCLLICGIAGALVGCVPPSSIPKTGAVLAPGAAPGYGPVVADIEDTVRQTMSRSRIPGLSVVICDSRGPIWEAGFGYGDDGRTVAVDGNTLFSIQSMSKTFTAVGVLTAVRDGLVDLDVPISRYLPDFRIQSIFEDRPQDRITLRHLLLHTVGFTHEAPGGGNFDGTEIAFDRHVANIQDTWLMCRVGERYQYSNLGIDLAGYVVERVSATPFIDYMGGNVFTALGLGRTTMDPSRIEAETNRATGHQRGVGRLPVIVPMTGAGGVYASAHDLGTFLTFMLREGRPVEQSEGQVLAPALFREMYTTPNHGGYGLGVAIGRRGSDLYFNHGGGGYGFLSFMAWYPTLDIGVAVLTNSGDHDSEQVRLVDRIVDTVEGAGLVQTRCSLTGLPVTDYSIGAVTDDSWYFDRYPERAAWRPEWKAHLGTYRLSLYAEPRWYARLLLAIGLPRRAFVKVRRQGNGMTIDGVQLLEHEPGLFFSKTGEALDFRSDPPTWRNVALTKR
jgi:CubicO group peptidase (beta-lactamase class C family)